VEESTRGSFYLIKIQSHSIASVLAMYGAFRPVFVNIVIGTLAGVRSHSFLLRPS
jgi:hypothetical protein